MKRKLTALILSALLACCPLALCANAQTTGEALGFSLLEQLYLQGENPLILSLIHIYSTPRSLPFLIFTPPCK